MELDSLNREYLARSMHKEGKHTFPRPYPSPPFVRNERTDGKRIENQVQVRRSVQLQPRSGSQLGGFVGGAVVDMGMNWMDVP